MNNTVMYFNPFTFAGNHPFVFKQGKMLGYCCLGQSKALPDMLYIALITAKTGNYL